MDRKLHAPQVDSFRCHVCDSTEARAVRVKEAFQINGKLVFVEDIPAQACRRCSELTFSQETTETVRRLVRREPMRVAQVPVFAFGMPA